MLAYGEDALTLWALGNLAGLLKALGDSTPEDEATVFYRPCFGRRSTSPREGATLRSEFGEFDAIVGTPVATHLIESKWSGSSESRKHIVQLGDAQLRRHAIFRIYLEQWQAAKPTAWEEFVSSTDVAARLAAYGARPPHAHTVMCRSLTTVLGLLRNCGPARDVLLFFRGEPGVGRRNGGAAPTEVSAPGFSLVYADCRAAESEGFIALPRPHVIASATFRLSPVTAPSL